MNATSPLATADVLTPEQLAERLARVTVTDDWEVVRRASLVSADDAPLTVGAMSVDLVTRRVTVDGEPVSLTATEFDLLAHLMQHPGRGSTRASTCSRRCGGTRPSSAPGITCTCRRSRPGPGR